MATDVFSIQTAVVFLGAALVYLLPTVVAAAREHHQGGAIAVLNILLGWTVLGWIAALVWAATATHSARREVAP